MPYRLWSPTTRSRRIDIGAGIDGIGIKPNIYLTEKQDWLKNTVVIIDPCVNPDGRDRYVNWFNETASQPYGLEAMNEYEDIIDHIYDDCELMGLDIDTMIHEMGAAQLEVNFIHGDPLTLTP